MICLGCLEMSFGFPVLCQSSMGLLRPLSHRRVFFALFTRRPSFLDVPGPLPVLIEPPCSFTRGEERCVRRETETQKCQDANAGFLTADTLLPAALRPPQGSAEKQLLGGALGCPWPWGMLRKGKGTGCVGLRNPQ